MCLQLLTSDSQIPVNQHYHAAPWSLLGGMVGGVVQDPVTNTCWSAMQCRLLATSSAPTVTRWPAKLGMPRPGLAPSRAGAVEQPDMPLNSVPQCERNWLVDAANRAGFDTIGAICQAPACTYVREELCQSVRLWAAACIPGLDAGVLLMLQSP